MLNWLRVKIRNVVFGKVVPNMITMTPETAWEIYRDIGQVYRVKDLLELRRQLAYIKAAEGKGRDSVEWGRVLELEDLLANVEEAAVRLKELREKKENGSAEYGGYKSTVT